MIPVRDVIPSRTTPVVTIAIILLNAAVFLYQVTLPDRALTRFIQEYGLIPARLAWMPALTSMFLHGGWLHLLGNMVYLWIFGDNVEDRLGHLRFLVFYLLCGVAAAIAQIAADPTSYLPMVGASGAVAGVVGAYFVLYPNSRVLALVPLVDVVEIPAIFFLAFWFLLQLMSGIGSIAPTAADDAAGIAFWAHLAGLAAGAAAVFVFKRPERLRVEWWNG